MVYALLNFQSPKSRSQKRYFDKLKLWIDEDDNHQYLFERMMKDATPFPSHLPKLKRLAITPSLLTGIDWSKVITIFNSKGEFQKDEVRHLIETLGETVEEKLYIIDALDHYIKELDANELPF